MQTGVKDAERASDRVYSQLLEWISTGRIGPGERVKILDVANLLGVSATPVREAISLLVRDGVLSFEPNRGSSVREYSSDEMEELFELRAMIEGLASRRAALSSGRETLIEKLREQIVLMRDAIDRLDRPAYNRYDLVFHELVLSQGVGPMVREHLRISELLTRVFSAMVRHDRREMAAMEHSDRDAIRRFKEGIEHHVELLEAIAGGDGQSAEQVGREHVLRFVRDGFGVAEKR